MKGSVVSTADTQMGKKGKVLPSEKLWRVERGGVVSEERHNSSKSNLVTRIEENIFLKGRYDSRESRADRRVSINLND